MASPLQLSGGNKSFMQFSDIMRKYLGINDVMEMNRLMMAFYKTCSGNKIDEKNVSLFTNYVINHESYIKRSRSIFKNQLTSLGLHTDADETQLYNEFAKPRIIGSESVHPITDEKVITFLKFTQSYKTSLNKTLIDVLKSEYSDCTLEEVPDDLIHFISDNCNNCETSTIRDYMIKYIADTGDGWIERDLDDQSSASEGITETDIPNTVACQTSIQLSDYLDETETSMDDTTRNNAPDIISIVNHIYEKNMGKPQAPDQLVKKVLHLLSNRERVVDFIVSQENTVVEGVSGKFSQDLISLFEQIYGRPITVHEYIKHSKKLSKHINYDSQAVLMQILRDTHIQFQSAMQTIDTIHENYLGYKVEQYKIISTFINRIEDPGFHEGIIEDILTDQYEVGMYDKKMKDTLKHLYKSTFDTDIPSDSDLHYYYSHAKASKYHLKSRDLPAMLHEKKLETDAFVKELEKLYHSILQRKPDSLEVIQYLAYYRNDLTNRRKVNHTNDMIKDELYDSLEYNDVLKDLIKTCFQEVFNKTLLPSIVYGLLKDISDNPNLKRGTKENIAQFISNSPLCKSLV